MSRNFELWQRSSDPIPATVIPSSPKRPERHKPIQVVDFHEESSEWLRAINIIKKRWRWSLSFAVLVVAGVSVFTLLAKPIYEPEAHLQVDPPGSEVFSLQDHSNSGAAVGYVETQAQNLQSDGLALDVIRALHLDQNQEFVAPAKRGLVLPNQPTDSAVQLTTAEDQALATFKMSRKVVRDTASRLITVSVGTHDPVLAASITNTLVDRFIERDFKTRNDAISQSSRWLQRQLDDIRQRMDDSNHALAALQNSSGIGALGDNQNTFSERMMELSRQLMQAQADRIQLQAYLDKLNAVQSSSLPQISNNPVVQQLTTKLAETRAELAQTLAVYGENHPNSKKLQNQVDELQVQLNSQRSAILSDMKTSYTAATARERLMQSQMDGATRQMTVLAQYNALKKEADANTQLYAALYQKIKEAAIAAETKSTNIRIVDQARVLSRPTRPHRLQNVAFGMLGGLAGGLLLAFLLEGMDTKIRTAEDIRRCLGAKSVSIVPVIGRGERYGLTRSGVKLLPLIARQAEDSRIFLLDQPNSPESEAIRGIYTAVRLSSRSDNAATRVLMIASPLSGEGKTMLSVNLAMALAQHGTTCIVDGDLRKGGAAIRLGVTAERGLANVLSGELALEEALVPGVRVPGLTLLPVGMLPTEPGTLIASNAMNEVVRKLRQKFEFVVIDSPPILPVADARSISVLVDGVIMVGRSGVTTRENMRRAMEMLQSVRSAPVLDFVLNATEYPHADYGYYKYGYGQTV